MTYDVLVDRTPLDTGSRFTGTGRFVAELGSALAALTDGERQGLAIGSLNALSGASAVGPLTWQGSARPELDADGEARWLLARRTELARTLRRLRPRLFHATYHLGTPRGSGVPRVVSCLDLVRLVLHEDYLPGRWFYRRVLAAAEWARFAGARRIQAISRYTADDLVRLLGIPASKIDVVLLGVDLERYRVLTDDELAAARAVRTRLGIDEKPYVFYAGNADPRKNVDILFRAFAEAKVPDLELLFFGKLRPSDRATVDRALAAAGNPKGVRLMGFVAEDDLPAVMNGAYGFVFCSTYEGFGNVPAEAMACGCPIVTTGATSIAEVVDGADLRVPPRDVSATASAIRRLATEPSLREQLGRAGAARAKELSWRRCALATVDSYARALR